MNKLWYWTEQTLLGLALALLVIACLAVPNNFLLADLNSECAQKCSGLSGMNYDLCLKSCVSSNGGGNDYDCYQTSCTKGGLCTTDCAGQLCTNAAGKVKTCTSSSNKGCICPD